MEWSNEDSMRDFISQAFQYTVYMHDLSVLLNNSNIGGKRYSGESSELCRWHVYDFFELSWNDSTCKYLWQLCYKPLSYLYYQGADRGFYSQGGGGGGVIKVTEKYLGNVGGSHGGGFGLPQENFEYEVL